jgi:hypothetical protein
VQAHRRIDQPVRLAELVDEVEGSAFEPVIATCIHDIEHIGERFQTDLRASKDLRIVKE